MTQTTPTTGGTRSVSMSERPCPRGCKTQAGTEQFMRQTTFTTQRFLTVVVNECTNPRCPEGNILALSPSAQLLAEFTRMVRSHTFARRLVKALWKERTIIAVTVVLLVQFMVLAFLPVLAAPK